MKRIHIYIDFNSYLVCVFLLICKSVFKLKAAMLIVLDLKLISCVVFCCVLLPSCNFD